MAVVVWSTFRLIRPKTPLYFQGVLFAVICGLLEFIFNSMVQLCTTKDFVPINIGALGAVGFYAFMFAVNFGQFDSIVDGGRAEYRTARIVSMIAPAVQLAFTVAFTVLARSYDLPSLLIRSIGTISVLPCSYFNLKIILMKDDGTDFVKGAKAANGFSLFYIIMQDAVIVFTACGLTVPTIVGKYILAAAAAMTAVSAVRGVKKWIN